MAFYLWLEHLLEDHVAAGVAGQSILLLFLDIYHEPKFHAFTRRIMKVPTNAYLNSMK